MDKAAATLHTVAAALVAAPRSTSWQTEAYEGKATVVTELRLDGCLALELGRVGGLGMEAAMVTGAVAWDSSTAGIFGGGMGDWGEGCCVRLLAAMIVQAVVEHAFGSLEASDGGGRCGGSDSAAPVAAVASGRWHPAEALLVTSREVTVGRTSEDGCCAPGPLGSDAEQPARPMVTPCSRAARRHTDAGASARQRRRRLPGRKCSSG